MAKQQACVPHQLRNGGASIPEFRSAENAIDAGLMFAPPGVALSVAPRPDSIVVLNPQGATAKAKWNN